MSKTLVIVESPAKAKTIKAYLGNNYTVTASMGHVRDLPKSKLGVDVEKDFAPEYITIRGKGTLLGQLRKQAKAADKILLATDPDREGEAISWHLANVLSIPEGQNCRITFNEITKTAVRAAIKNPRQIDQDLVDAQQARRILDRVVGYSISPLLWKNIKKGLSAGRVQSVATKMIVDREAEIDAFTPKEYWSIIATLLSGKKKFQAKLYGKGNEKLEIGDASAAERIYKEIKDAVFTVTKVKLGERKRMPSPAFITSTLQQEASRKLGFTASRTMSAAQQLYEGVDVKGRGTVGLITYMRTDSVRISEEAQKAAREVIAERYGKEYLPAKAPQYKGKKNAQDAHEAIRPSYADIRPETLKDQLKPDLYKLYKLIWEQFIASQMIPAVYDTITADIDAAGYTFRASGSSVKVPGFTVVTGEIKEEKDEDISGNVPVLKEGEVLTLKELDQKQHFTQPPARYTEASLIRELEEKGIGRPSTYAPTIGTIIARGYVTRDKKQLVPTELGKVVTDLMKNYFSKIVDIDFTAKMEEDLDEVEEGNANWKALLRTFYGPFKENLDAAAEKISKIEVQDEVSDVPCEKCGRMMVYKMGKFGKFLACPGFPECRNTKPIVVEAGIDCPLCGKKVLIKKSPKGRKYFGCEKNPSCKFMTWDEPTKEKCPKCGGMLLKKNKGRNEKFVCYNEGCDYER